MPSTSLTNYRTQCYLEVQLANGGVVPPDDTIVKVFAKPFQRMCDP
jgi:hypothetical protein